MAGTYAHLTLVTLLGSPNELKGLGGLDPKALGPLLSYSKYTELGAVSPDYPYLTITGKSAKGWADAMHYERTGDRLRAGVEYVLRLEGEEKYKALAWILGFTSHIITDISIHPVVELKVGPYAENAKHHRVCEMHQDVFIYQRMNVGEIYCGNFIHDGIAACSGKNKHTLDPLVQSVWDHMLRTVDNDRYASEPPEFNKWHRRFRRMISAAGTGKFLPCSRHLLAAKGVEFPKKASDGYIRGLAAPGGRQMDYEDIFLKAKDNVRHFWGLVCRYCLTDDKPDLSVIRNWDLDTGRDESGTITLYPVGGMMRRILLIFLCALQFTACAGLRGMDDEAHNRKAIDLRRLGNAVQGELWRGADPGRDLLALACSRDPDLCTPFSSFSILVSVVDGNVALLLCDAKQTRALIEDIACTPETDFRAWEAENAPCAFTLDITAACTPGNRAKITY